MTNVLGVFIIVIIVVTAIVFISCIGTSVCD